MARFVHRRFAFPAAAMAGTVMLFFTLAACTLATLASGQTFCPPPAFSHRRFRENLMNALQKPQTLNVVALVHATR